MKFKDSKMTNQNELIFQNVSFFRSNISRIGIKAHVSCMFSCDFTSFYIEDLKKHTKIHYSSENPPRSDLRGGDINRINRKGPGSHQDPISNTQ